jgi:hypothetical protein
VKGTYTTDIYDFDAKVNVQPPDKEDTKDVTAEVAAQLAKQP